MIACLGLIAILLQALLFGWHTHDPPVSGRGEPTQIRAAGSGGDHDLGAEDACEICFSLHHHGSAAPPLVVNLPTPHAVGRAALLLEEELAARGIYLLFRSRAPPSI